MVQLTFNPGLTLTGFRTTRPWIPRKLVKEHFHTIVLFWLSFGRGRYMIVEEEI